MEGPTISDDEAVDAPIAPAHLAIERGALIGRYIAIEKLGEGGMGVVYAAYDPELDRKIAIKLLREDQRGTGSIIQTSSRSTTSASSTVACSSRWS